MEGGVLYGYGGGRDAYDFVSMYAAPSPQSESWAVSGHGGYGGGDGGGGGLIQEQDMKGSTADPAKRILKMPRLPVVGSGKGVCGGVGQGHASGFAWIVKGGF